MAHRVRSRTAESAENKKTKVTPRRLTEKIAIMRRREHEQSEAFQKAMKSIFEACTVTPVCVCVCVCCVCCCRHMSTWKWRLVVHFISTSPLHSLFLFSFRPPRFNWVLRGFPFYCNTNVVLLCLGACAQRGLQWLLCVSVSLSVTLTSHFTSYQSLHKRYHVFSVGCWIRCVREWNSSEKANMLIRRGLPRAGQFALCMLKSQRRACIDSHML